MSKITVSNVGSLTTEPTSAQSAINSNFSTVQTAIDNTLSRDGTSPNQMESNLDMNNFQILNLPSPATANSPARLQDLATVTGGGTVANMPSGGTTGQVLAKNSNTSYDIKWQDQSTDLAAGSNIVLTGTTPTTIATSANPSFSTSVTTPEILNSTGTLSINTSGTVTVPSVTDTLVGKATTDTLTNKTLTSPVINSATLSTPSISISAPTTNAELGFTTGVAPNWGDGTVNHVAVSADQTQTLTNKTIDTAGPNTIKIAGTSLAAVTGTGSVVLDTSPSLSSPTLTTPHVSSIINTGTLTLPTSTDTLVGRTTTDTLTNKTVDTAGPNTIKVGGVTLAVGEYPGTATNDNATAGNIGEYISSSIPSGSAVSLTSGNSFNIVSVSLTPGDWDITGAIIYQGTTTTTVIRMDASISTTSGTFNNTYGDGSSWLFYGNETIFNTATGCASILTGPFRLSLSATTTVYLIGRAVFGASTCSAYGIIRARRMR